MQDKKKDVQLAVRQLLIAGYRLSPMAIPKLMQANDPVMLVSQFLSNHQKGNGKLLEFHDIASSTKLNTHTDPVRKVAPSSMTVSSINNRMNFPENRKKVASSTSSVLRTSTSLLTGLPNYEPNLEVIWEPNFSRHRMSDLSDFVGYFRSRYQKLSSILKNRPNTRGTTQIRRLKALKERDEVTVIAMVTSKQFPTGGGALIELEDPYSETTLTAVVSKTDESLVNQFVMIMDDTVIAVRGILLNEEKIAVKEIILPDIPRTFTPRTSEIPVHAAFLSDIHIGSKGFLSKPFERFIDFLNGNYGNKKMRLLGQHTKYVMFAGDVVDGVGIFPNQEEELSILDIHEQYNLFARFLEKIPGDVQIVIIPGNHDHVRPAEPQPVIKPQYAPELHGLPNVTMLPNPAQVSLHGVNTLLYHCTSLPDILNHLPGLKTEKPAEVMIKMLQARHLAPVWGSRTPIAPEEEDNLVIERIPDIFHGGHIHINDIGYYNGVRILNSGTMQEQTSYQKALNIVPTPGEVLVVNLQDHTPNLLRLM